MTLKQELRDLVLEVQKAGDMLAKITVFRAEFSAGDFKTLGRSRVAAITLAEVFLESLLVAEDAGESGVG